MATAFLKRKGKFGKVFVTSLFLPTQLSGLSLWLRSDLGVTHPGSTATGWADQSGNGNDAIASSAPTYSANGGVNSFPVLTFASASSNKLTGTFASSISAHTVFIVARWADMTQNTCPFAATVGTTANTSFALFTELSVLQARDSSAGTSYSAVTTDLSTSGSVGVYSSGGDNSTVDIEVNGSSKNSHSALTDAANQFVVGSVGSNVYYFNGDIYEIIVYGRVLTAPERLTVTRYLGARYSIVVP